ncbi:MAG: hypothetical protein HYV33_02325 [Candidatus Kerfeldbacteria bacterium]|nr:hypothetical protein [Candidatus Kerfeldbacteria bacterium]
MALSKISRNMQEYLGQHTFRLFDRPKFVDGLTSFIDFRKQMDKYKTDETANMADVNSLASDWKAVGSDMQSALLKYGRESSDRA